MKQKWRHITNNNNQQKIILHATLQILHCRPTSTYRGRRFRILERHAIRMRTRFRRDFRLSSSVVCRYQSYRGRCSPSLLPAAVLLFGLHLPARPPTRMIVYKIHRRVVSKLSRSESGHFTYSPALWVSGSSQPATQHNKQRGSLESCSLRRRQRRRRQPGLTVVDPVTRYDNSISVNKSIRCDR